MRAPERTRFDVAVLTLLPAAIASFALALRFPHGTEVAYSRSIYPVVARAFALVNRVPFSLAEPVAVAVTVLAIGMAFFGLRRRERRWRRTLLWTWGTGGIVAAGFLASWGLNYARPSLAQRTGLTDGVDVDARTVLASGTRTAALTSTLFEALEDQRTPTVSPMSFEQMNRELDDAFIRLALPGDTIAFTPTPAKPLASSTLFSYLGISGVFVPFTGEPSVNVLQPDAALPIVMAHEKAHQRGVTNEGEANFAAFLACADVESPIYFRYAAYLFATRYLLGEASAYLPSSEVDRAWSHMSEGPQEDLRAIRDFWRGYQGAASTVMSHANDRYLKAMQVPGGAQSYGTVVQLLMALDARDELLPQAQDER